MCHLPVNWLLSPSIHFLMSAAGLSVIRLFNFYVARWRRELCTVGCRNCVKLYMFLLFGQSPNVIYSYVYRCYFKCFIFQSKSQRWKSMIYIYQLNLSQINIMKYGCWKKQAKPEDTAKGRGWYYCCSLWRCFMNNGKTLKNRLSFALRTLQISQTPNPSWQSSQCEMKYRSIQDIFFFWGGGGLPLHLLSSTCPFS